MAQIQKGETFTNGQQVDATRLNQLVDSSVLLVGSISEQTSIATNTLEATDSTIVNDAGVLKKATIGDILNSGLDTTFDVCINETTQTSVLSGKTNKDINVTPNDGVAVTGKSFTSVDGITAVVTSIAHGLESNMLINATASNAVYTGQHIITVISVDSFSFVISQTTPVGASGTLDYTTKGSVKTTGSQYVSNQLTVGGLSKLNNVTAGSLTSSGVANFTGSLQVNGTTAYALYEIFEANVTYSNATVPAGWNAMYTSASLTKPSDEIWIIESDLRWRRTLQLVWSVRINQTTPSTILNATVDIEGAGSDYWHIENNVMRYVFNAGTTFTSTFTLDVMPVSVAGYAFYVGEANYPTAGTALTAVNFPPSKFRIYKYKTA